MTPERTYKTGDTKVRFGATLSADVLDMTGATVRFIMKHKAGTKTIEGAAVNDEGSHVYFLFTGTDLDTKGTYKAEWEVTFPSGAIQTFPDDDYHEIKVIDDLD